MLILVDTVKMSDRIIKEMIALIKSYGKSSLSLKFQVVNKVWSYIDQLVFNILVLVGAVKMSDRIILKDDGL